MCWFAGCEINSTVVLTKKSCIRCAESVMPLKSLQAASRAVNVRLALWYSAIFSGSALLLAGLMYALFAYSITQIDRHEIVEELREYSAAYADGGLPAIIRLDLQERQGKANETL